MRLRPLGLFLLGCTVCLPSAAQVTLTRGANLALDVSTDGRIAIDLAGDLWVIPGGGGEARPLTDNLKSVQRPRWSPDARRLAYQSNRDGRQGIWLYDFTTGESQSINAESRREMHPAWHPNGERIVYAADRLQGELDLWEVDLQTGLHWRLSDRPGDETEPAWSSDGRNLVYVSQHAQRWSLILRRHGQPEEVLLSSSDRLAAPTWRPDGSLITYFRQSAAATTLDMVILSSPKLVRTLDATENFDATPVSWLNREQMVYSADGQLRQRSFNAWRSYPLAFRATMHAAAKAPGSQTRPELTWPGEPTGKLVIRASRLFDGINKGYQYDKDIVISGGRVADVQDHADRPGTIVIDMGDLTILPGYVDADARLPSDLAASHGPDMLTTGVTTVVTQHAETDKFNLLWSGKNIPGPRMLRAAQWPITTLSRPELDVTAAVVTSRSTGRLSGVALATQFRAMSMAGLSAEQTLRAIGVNAAAAMRSDPYLGRIATGASADLVFVDGDPLSNISDALNVVAVVRNGRFYSVSGLMDRANSAETVD